MTNIYDFSVKAQDGLTLNYQNTKVKFSWLLILQQVVV